MLAYAPVVSRRLCRMTPSASTPMIQPTAAGSGFTNDSGKRRSILRRNGRPAMSSNDSTRGAGSATQKIPLPWPFQPEPHDARGDRFVHQHECVIRAERDAVGEAKRFHVDPGLFGFWIVTQQTPGRLAFPKVENVMALIEAL